MGLNILVLTLHETKPKNFCIPQESLMTPQSCKKQFNVSLEIWGIIKSRKKIVNRDKFGIATKLRKSKMYTNCFFLS